MAQKPKLKYMTILILYYATFFLLSKLNQINKLILTVNGKEITRNNTKKFIGALHLLNKSVIRVKY